jgi:site-specific DNA-cytosine methylase
VPTLNAFDNGGDTRATVLIIGFSHTQGLDCQPNEKHWPTLRKNGAGMAVLIIDGTRVGDVRIYDDEIMQTVIQRWGTGGGNVPAIQEIDKPAVVRRLTPVECERLQGFPDDWTADQADSNRYKQMGNAVTVNVIAWIGARL